MPSAKPGLSASLAAGLMLALFACSKPVDIVVGQTSVGPLTIKTAFDVAVVEKLLPRLDVEAAVSSALQPGEHVIRVSDGGTPLFEIYPALSRKTIESVLVLDKSIKDEKGDVADITVYDVLQSNGVIHSIDKVLLPAS